ncbi:MAG: four helix bundle protein [Gemmatimonadales bacterium]|nr:four helix bundle protein [Gemmatimonadales bacterium]
MGDYRSLRVWQTAKQLVVLVYRVTDALPGSERHGLTAQLRRAAISVPANVAEGAGRGSDRELRRFVAIAWGSAQEVICELELAVALGFLRHAEVSESIACARRVAGELTRLREALEGES